jgi:hypothetical protein
MVRRMAEGSDTVEAMAGAVVFGEGTVQALAGVADTAEALGGVPFIPRGAQATLQPTGHTT